MRRTLTTSLLLAIIFSSAMLDATAQDGARLDDIKGHRLKTGIATFIYASKLDNTIDMSDYRTLNHSVFFVQITPAVETTMGANTYVQIKIPGTQKPVGALVVKNGQPVSPIDFDQLFWIDKSMLQDLQPEYFVFRNDIVLGALTLPFKYRPRSSGNNSSVVDGSVNIGPYFGYKWRLGKNRPFYVSAVISGGLTSLTYSSANNKGIIEPEQTETGFGFQYGGGIVFDLYKIQLGFILGADSGMGDLSRTFIYQNKLWAGFSLNFNFLSRNIDRSDSGNN